jgi:hypothetical protein
MILADADANVRRVRGSHVRFRHGETRADIPVQKRAEPLLLLPVICKSIVMLAPGKKRGVRVGVRVRVRVRWRIVLSFRYKKTGV